MKWQSRSPKINDRNKNSVHYNYLAETKFHQRWKSRKTLYLRWEDLIFFCLHLVCSNTCRRHRHQLNKPHNHSSQRRWDFPGDQDTEKEKERVRGIDIEEREREAEGEKEKGGRRESERVRVSETDGVWERVRGCEREGERERERDRKADRKGWREKERDSTM